MKHRESQSHLSPHQESLPIQSHMPMKNWRRHDTQHNDIQLNDTQHNNIHHNDTLHKGIICDICDIQHINTLL